MDTKIVAIIDLFDSEQKVYKISPSELDKIKIINSQIPLIQYATLSCYYFNSNWLLNIKS